MTWDPAQAYCESLGGNLPSIHDQAQNDELWAANSAENPTMYGKEIHIGLRLNNGRWEWTDGTLYNFSNWYDWGNWPVAWDSWRCTRIASEGMWKNDDCSWLGKE